MNIAKFSTLTSKSSYHVEGTKIFIIEPSIWYCLYSITYHVYRLIGLDGRAFDNGLGDLGSIPGRVIPKTLKMVLDTSLPNTQQYKVHIKGKIEQSRERSSALPYTLAEYLLKWEPSGHLWQRSQTLPIMSCVIPRLFQNLQLVQTSKTKNYHYYLQI